MRSSILLIFRPSTSSWSEQRPGCPWGVVFLQFSPESMWEHVYADRMLPVNLTDAFDDGRPKGLHAIFMSRPPIREAGETCRLE